MSRGRSSPTAAAPAATTLRRKCACAGNQTAHGTCRQCLRKQPQPARPTRAQDGIPEIVTEVIQAPGRPLPESTRAQMEPRFGHDFTQVRVHTDARAAESARSVGALAYTVGRDIAFDSGQFAPASPRGQRLLAHELGHVVQAGDAVGAAGIGPSDAPEETEADRGADRVMAGFDALAGPRGSSGASLRREPRPGATCDPSAQQPLVTAAFALAAQWLKKAVDGLPGAGATGGARSAAPIDPAVEAALQTHFHTSSASPAAARVRANLETLLRNVSNPPPHSCDFANCKGEDAAVPAGTKSIRLCPPFFASGKTAEYRAQTVVHEMAHIFSTAAPGSQTARDHALYEQKIYPMLGIDEAVDNADSYSGFAREVGGGKRPVIRRQQDSVSRCPSPPYPADAATVVRKAAARAAQWSLAAAGTLITQPQGVRDLLKANIRAYDPKMDKALAELHRQMMGRLEQASVAFECSDCSNGQVMGFYNVKKFLGLIEVSRDDTLYLCKRWFTTGGERDKAATIYQLALMNYGDLEEAAASQNARLAAAIADRVLPAPPIQPGP